MTPEAATALEESIAHWKRMRKLKTWDARKKSEEVPSSADCSLCDLFAIGRRSICTGCPVHARTGGVLCRKTPYGEARDAFYSYDDTAWQKAATAEIKFLESLRDG